MWLVGFPVGPLPQVLLECAQRIDFSPCDGTHRVALRPVGGLAPSNVRAPDPRCSSQSGERALTKVGISPQIAQTLLEWSSLASLTGSGCEEVTYVHGVERLTRNG